LCSVTFLDTYHSVSPVHKNPLSLQNDQLELQYVLYIFFIMGAILRIIYLLHKNVKEILTNVKNSPHK
jgi:hypothetical protein